MIFRNPRIIPDIYPEVPPPTSHDNVPQASATPRNSRSHFLALPTEIRLQIHHYYLLSLNLPAHFFTHLTMLGHWSDATGDVTYHDTRGYNLGRRISKPLLSLLLLNHQIRLEAEAVLYGSFVFCIPPRLSSARTLRAFYAQKGARVAPRLRNVQINLSLRTRWWKMPPVVIFDKWRAALEVLVTELPALQRVGLAVDCSQQAPADVRTRKDAIELVLSFARVFKSVPVVHLRFADVDYERYGQLPPISSPVCAELLEEEKLLLRLRDDDKLIWHRVAMHFNEPSSEMYSVTGLQARYNRLKIRQQQTEMEAECLKKWKEVGGTDQLVHKHNLKDGLYNWNA